jgi:probable selenium-dependent hydroxylase accessory protein YqeC
MELIERAVDTTLTEDLLVQLVEHPAGCWKGIPPTSRTVAVINQADTSEDIEKAQSVGKRLLDLGAARVVITGYSSAEPVKALLRH